MPLTNPNFVAGGPIYPRRFVSPQAAAAYWLTSTAYKPGNLVTLQHGSGTSVDLYVCLVAHSSGTFNTDLTAGDWALVSPQPSSRTNWANGTVYTVGQVVTYSATPGTTNALEYICLKGHTAGTFSTDLTAGDWLLFDNIESGSLAVIQSTAATARILGVSMEGTNYPPLNDPRITVTGYAAIQGEELQVYGLGEVCLLDLGGTVLFGAALTADSNGKGVSMTPGNTTVNYQGAIALQAGVSGEAILVQVMPQIVLV